MNWKYNNPLQNLFSYATLLLLATGCILLYFLNRENIFLYLNNQHTYVGDLIFKYFTHAGDGLVMIAAAVFVFFIGKRKLAFLLILSFLVTGLFVQVLKRVNEKPRPGLFFKNPMQVHKVDGEILKGKNSFPSGHTTTAFAMFSLLAFTTRKKELQLLYFLTALVIGYSRIYLGQHFFEDVLAGAALGFFTSLMLMWLFRKKEWE
jgi:membrane-associated phospholipid phosphatase